MKDTNGDDKADLRESLMTGWSTRDTHALASNLKYGLDNWIWGAVGYSGFNGTVGGQALTFNQALYRFSRGRQADGAHGELHEQHVGPGLQRDVRRVRLDRQRRAQRLRRDSAAVLPGREGPERRRQEEDRRALRDAGEHAEDPAGGRAGRVHGGGRAQLLHGARVPGGVLEPRRLRERADRARRAPRDHRARRAPASRRRTAGTSPRATTSGLRRCTPKWGPTARCGSSISTTSSSSTTRRRSGRSRRDTNT